MKKFFQRIAAAIRREPPELARIDHSPLVTDESMHELDRELDSGHEPDALDERRD
jgi:hypothetical protein